MADATTAAAPIMSKPPSANPQAVDGGTHANVEPTTEIQVHGCPTRADMEQKLPADLLWRTAKHFLHSPRDVYSLARTSSTMWQWLSTELLVTELIWWDERSELLSWDAYKVVFGEPELRCKMSALHWLLTHDFPQTAIKLIDLVPMLKLKMTLRSLANGYCYTGETAIYLAAKRGQKEVLHRLHAVDSRIMTIDISTQMFVGEVFRMSAGRFHTLDPACRDTSNGTLHGAYKLDAVAIAILGGQFDVAHFLLECGAGRWAHDMSRDRADAPISLAFAALYGQVSITEKLLQNRHDPLRRLPLFLGATPLHLAASRKTDSGVLGAILIFIRNTRGDHDAEKLLNHQDTLHRTPAHWAALHRSVASCQVLLDWGACFTAENSNYPSPLDLLAEADDCLEVTRKVLEDLSVPEAMLQHSFKAAIDNQEEAYDTIRLFVQRNPNLLLTRWCIRSRAMPTHVLRRRGADVERYIDICQGYSNVLHATVRSPYCSMKVLKLLLAQPAIKDVIDSPDNHGDRPIEYAMEDAVAHLVVAGATVHDLRLLQMGRIRKICEEAGVTSTSVEALSRRYKPLQRGTIMRKRKRI
ncbi:ankyrin repeat-containing domain protein [Xylariaceae sp. FL0804]|nr:ankyrin repeat-containing domain protein [Xylariaceae sp. FL0804]